MKEYVAGFLVDTEEVLLVQKLKPDWQKGKWNAIGGKIEKNESPNEAMVREFKEEVGIEVVDWNQFCTLSGKDFIVYFYISHDFPLGETHKGVNDVGEKLRWFSIENIINQETIETIRNIPWLLCMALDESDLKFSVNQSEIISDNKKKEKE